MFSSPSETCLICLLPLETPISQRAAVRLPVITEPASSSVALIWKMKALGPVAAALWRVAHSPGRRGAAFNENIALPTPYGHVKYALGSLFK